MNYARNERLSSRGCSMSLLKICDLHVSFKAKDGNHQVLQGINLHVARGEAVALVGESGSGKSVAALAVMRLLGKNSSFDSGEIWFDGIPLHTLDERGMQFVRGRKIGMVFQDPMSALNPTMTAGRQIAESLECQEKISNKKNRQRVLELLDLVGIAEPALRYDAYPFQLSGGMRQRIVIAIALACQPAMLIADEPTTALDVTVQAQILDLIMKVCQERAMGLLLISHDLGVVARVCTRVAVMHQGKIVEEGGAHQIFYSPRHPYTRHLLTL